MPKQPAQFFEEMRYKSTTTHITHSANRDPTSEGICASLAVSTTRPGDLFHLSEKNVFRRSEGHIQHPHAITDMLAFQTPVRRILERIPSECFVSRGTWNATYDVRQICEIEREKKRI